MRKKTTIKFNLWDYVDIEDINDIIDDEESKGYPTDINYKIKDIKKNGTITLDANYDLEVYDEYIS
jgi:hypothetical protein